jgi:HEAT repeat protein
LLNEPGGRNGQNYEGADEFFGMAMKTYVLAIVGFCFLPLAGWASAGQERTSVSKLFEKLQSETTTNQALEELLRIDPSDASACRYLSAHLPALISQLPQGNPQVWLNAIKVAGAFRIKEAIPALVKWIGVPASDLGGLSLSERAGLEPFSAGKALAQIGEPAVPALVNVLQKGTTRERIVASRALIKIHSPVAITALRDRLSHEQDQNLKLDIQRAVDSN